MRFKRIVKNVMFGNNIRPVLHTAAVVGEYVLTTSLLNINSLAN